jgi:RNA-binding protein YlmH
LEWNAVIDEPSEIEDAEIESDADESSDVEHLRFAVTKDLTRRIDQYLTDRISHLSRSGVQRLIEEGLVKVNGRVIKASYRTARADQRTHSRADSARHRL